MPDLGVSGSFANFTGGKKAIRLDGACKREAEETGKQELVPLSRAAP